MQNDLSDRIKELKALRNKAVLENRREVYSEVSERKEKIVKEITQDDVLDTGTEAARNDAEFSSKEKLNGSIKDLEYTAEETEEWLKSRGRDQSTNDDNTEAHNFKILAAKTYNKNLKELEKSGLKRKEEYIKEKIVYSQLKAQGLSEAEIRSKMTSTENLDKFVKKVEKWERSVYQKRGKVEKEGIDSAIHEKNRQFNQKLKRHLSKIEK